MNLPDLTFTPAYGRDYKSKTAAIADFNADKDFLLGGKPINRPQLPDGTPVRIRYAGLRRVVCFKVDRNARA